MDISGGVDEGLRREYGRRDWWAMVFFEGAHWFLFLDSLADGVTE